MGYGREESEALLITWQTFDHESQYCLLDNLFGQLGVSINDIPGRTNESMNCIALTDTGHSRVLALSVDNSHNTVPMLETELILLHS